ncbi:alkaline phosphatase family protein [bacterium]|nr:alkaline phosphatase family protein [bacterium]
MSSAKLKVLILGLDGFDPDLFAKWRRDLPNLNRLASAGVMRPLRSTTPPMTFPAWSTFLTGANPGKHGIFDFTERIPGKMGVRFLNATRRRYPTFLKQLSDAGVRVGSIGIPTTYPPEPLNGFTISGFDTPLPSKADRTYLYPPELSDLLQERLGGYSFGDFNESKITAGWHGQVLKQLFEGITRKIETAELLIDEYAPELLAVHVGETDTVGHHFWSFCDACSPRHVKADSAEVGDAIQGVYQAADKLVGELIAKGQPELTLVVSDHGMGGTSDRMLYLNRFLEQAGFLKFNSGSVLSRSMAPLKKLGMTWLPYRWQQQVFRLADGKIASNIESMQRFGGIDWAETVAFSEELNYFSSIWLNVRGRDPFGCIAPEDVPKAAKILKEALLSWRDPADNQPVINAVHTRAELYDGPEINFAPDLILELNRPEGYNFALGRTLSPHGIAPWRRLDPEEYIGYKGGTMNGSHRQYGTLMLYGTNIAADLDIPHPTLEDIAPTVLDYLNLPKAAWMDGKSLFSESQDAASVARQNPDEAPYSQQEEASIRRKLEQLGYLD